MKLVALVFALALPTALAGCDKHRGNQAEASSTKPVAAATQSPTPVKVLEASATAPAAGSGSEMSCGDETGGGATCGGETGGGCNQWDEAAAEVAKRDVPTDAEWKTIPVSGMTCGGCERRVIANLGKVEGVLAVEADAELGEVRIAMAKGQDLRSVAVDTINALGYKAQ